MKTFIYTLEDPRTKEIRYIGKSDNIEKRIKSHITRSKKRKLIQIAGFTLYQKMVINQKLKFQMKLIMMNGNIGKFIGLLSLNNGGLNQLILLKEEKV